jgi:hypothetical protein
MQRVLQLQKMHIANIGPEPDGAIALSITSCDSQSC